MESKEKPQKKVTLLDFIERYHNLFTVIGVMGGLAALFTRLENAEYLSVLSFIMLVLLDIQLWFSFPRNEEASIGITVFEMFFQLFIFAIGFYIFERYWEIIKPFLVVLLTLGFFGLFSGVYIVLNRKFKVHLQIRAKTPEGKKSSGLVRVIIASGSLTILAYIAYLIANLILQLAGLA